MNTMTDTPRVEAILNGEHPQFRIAGLAMELERELRIQTDLANHWKEECARLREDLVGDKATDPED